MPTKNRVYQDERLNPIRQTSQPAAMHLAMQGQARTATRHVAARPGSPSAASQELRQLQRTIGNHAVGRLLVQAARRPIPTHSRVAEPVIQRTTALQTFQGVLRRIAWEIGGRLGSIAEELSRFNKLDEPNTDTHELKVAFASAWEGTAQDETAPGDDRVMLENLIQSDWYGTGNALKRARLERDRQIFLRVGPGDIHRAFENALFFPSWESRFQCE